MYTTVNLLKKNERLEDIVSSQQKYVDGLSETIKYCNNHIKKIDEKGTFSSDDEIGWFFQEIKNLTKSDFPDNGFQLSENGIFSFN